MEPSKGVPYPILFKLVFILVILRNGQIHKVEMGCCLVEFVIRLLLYVDDLTLIANLVKGLQDHIYALECFCSLVGMQVNINKPNVMIFFNRRKKSQHKFHFEGNILEEVMKHKYLGIDFNGLNWEGCRKSETLGGWKVNYMLFKIYIWKELKQSIMCLIRYLERIEQMEVGRWPKVVFNDNLNKIKKTWMRQNNRWTSK